MTNPEQIRFERGVFTLSIDFELIWGTLAGRGVEKYRKQCELERQFIIDRLLALLVEFNLPASWLVVGHLFLDRCGVNHELSQANFTVPCPSSSSSGSEDVNSIFCGRSLVEKIQDCVVPQEIGCHTFSHPIFTEENISRERAEAELAACVRLSNERGIRMQSFVYPQNKSGYVDLLRKYGFTCYRGAEWHERGHIPDLLRRIVHFGLVCTAAKPPVYLPEFTSEGIWKLPGSMLYFPMHGRRRLIPLSLRVNRARKGLEAAVKQKRIFHLWLHPTNLVDEMEQMFTGLRSIFEHAANLRERGLLDFKTMGATVPTPILQQKMQPAVAVATVS